MFQKWCPIFHDGYHKIQYGCRTTIICVSQISMLELWMFLLKSSIATRFWNFSNRIEICTFTNPKWLPYRKILCKHFCFVDWSGCSYKILQQKGFNIYINNYNLKKYCLRIYVFDQSPRYNTIETWHIFIPRSVKLSWGAHCSKFLRCPPNGLLY